MACGHQARKHRDATLADVEVMIAAQKALPATLDDPQPSPLTSIDRGELIEVDYAMSDAVHGAIGALGGEIVEHDHSGIVLSKIVLQCEDLPAIAQRALRQKANLGQTVNHNAA